MNVFETQLGIVRSRPERHKIQTLVNEWELMNSPLVVLTWPHNQAQRCHGLESSCTMMDQGSREPLFYKTFLSQTKVAEAAPSH